jgi:imidazolonepropionase-like amidohydrolase
MPVRVTDRDDRWLVTADRVWDGTGAATAPDGFVLVEGGTIAAVGRRADLGQDLAAKARHLDGVTLLPGLVNAHVHLTFSASRTVLDDYLREQAAGVATQTVRAVDNLGRALRVGVTTVRDCGTVNEVAFPVRAAVASGLLPGPRVLTSGRGITTTGGHCWYLSVEADTADEVRKAVRAQIKAGADLIKVFGTGGNLTPGTNPLAPQYSVAELTAAVTEANRLGRRVAVHAHAAAGIRNAVAAGAHSIEHCSFETADGIKVDEATLATMAEAGTVAVLTLGASLVRLVEHPEVIDTLPPDAQAGVRRLLGHVPQMGAALRSVIGAGVTVVAGSDAGIPMRPFDDFPADLAALAHPAVGSGMTPAEVLAAGTVDAARACGLSDTGLLVPGMRADVLGVAGDPLRDLTDLTRTRFVACGGRVVRSPW